MRSFRWLRAMRNGDIKENDAHGLSRQPDNILRINPCKACWDRSVISYRAAERPKDNIIPKDFFNEISVSPKNTAVKMFVDTQRKESAPWMYYLHWNWCENVTVGFTVLLPSLDNLNFAWKKSRFFCSIIKHKILLFNNHSQCQVKLIVQTVRHWEVKHSTVKSFTVKQKGSSGSLTVKTKSTHKYHA